MVVNSENISRFSRCALRPVLGAFLRGIGGKIAEIPQRCALGTTLQFTMKLGILLAFKIYRKLIKYQNGGLH